MNTAINKKDYWKLKYRYPKKNETKEEKFDRLMNNYLLEFFENQKQIRRYFVPRSKKRRRKRRK